MMPIAFEVFICAGAVFYKRKEVTLYKVKEPTSLDTFAIWYTAILAIIWVGLMVTMLIVTISCTTRKVDLNRKLQKI